MVTSPGPLDRVRNPGRPGGRSAPHDTRADGSTIPNRDQGRSLRIPPGEIQRVSIGLLEKLNRADVAHLEQLREIVVPELWGEDELSYSVLPMRYASAEAWPTFLVVYLPGQLFGAYEFGNLVRWGPISTGTRTNPTSSGRFALNWRSSGRASTIDPDWFMRWYFNFGNREGLALPAASITDTPLCTRIAHNLRCTQTSRPRARLCACAAPPVSANLVTVVHLRVVEGLHDDPVRDVGDARRTRRRAFR